MVFWALSPPRDLPYFRSTATTAMPSFFSSPWRDFIWSEVSSAGAADDGENASNTPPPSVASASFSSFSCSSVRCDSVQTCSAMSPSDMTALCGMVHDRGGSCSVGARPRRGTRRGRAPTLQPHGLGSGGAEQQRLFCAQVRGGRQGGLGRQPRGGHASGGSTLRRVLLQLSLIHISEPTRLG